MCGITLASISSIRRLTFDSTEQSNKEAETSLSILTMRHRSHVPIFLTYFVFFLDEWISSHGNEVPSRSRQNDDCPVMLSPHPPINLTRIVGGDPAGAALASSIVLVWNSENFYITGILLSSTVVAFFAAHGPGSDGLYNVSFQSDPSSNQNGSFSEVQVHPSFSTSPTVYDIAYGILSSPAPTNTTTVKVNVDRNYPEVGAFVRYVGNGFTDPRAEYQVNTVNQVDVPVIDESSCAEKFPEYSEYILDGKLYCSGYSDRYCKKWFVSQSSPINHACI